MWTGRKSRLTVHAPGVTYFGPTGIEWTTSSFDVLSFGENYSSTWWGWSHISLTTKIVKVPLFCHSLYIDHVSLFSIVPVPSKILNKRSVTGDREDGPTTSVVPSRWLEVSWSVDTETKVGTFMCVGMSIRKFVVLLTDRQKYKWLVPSW